MLAPLIPIDIISPIGNSCRGFDERGKLVDGKYFLAGSTGELYPYTFADYYADLVRAKYTSRQFQFDTGVNINCTSCCRACLSRLVSQ